MATGQEVVIEPVKATGGLPCTPPLPVVQTKDGLRLAVDGAQTRTVYYVVEFGN